MRWLLSALLAVLMAVGVTQPGGAGTTIYIYDDASSASGTGYTFTEISAAFPADFVDNGTNRRSYRAKVSLQIGDTGVGTATTTLTDTRATVIWDNTKTLLTRATQTGSWYLRLGTKIGTGDQASGVDGCDLTFGAAVTWPRQAYLYGCTMRQTAGAFQQSSLNGASEYVNCIFQSSASGTTPMSFGTFGGSEFDNIYNLDISHTTTAQVMSNFYAFSAERVTVACAAPTTFLNTSGISVSIKDLAMFGSPTQSDLRWTSPATARDWVLVRPKWTGNAPKFSAGNSTSHLAGDETYEYWLYDVKCVDGAGAGVSGIPVRLTDTLGNVQVDTTTDTNGRVSFGSGITANAVAVMDHYSVSGVYTQRHRGPFLCEVNLPSQTGYNNNYFSHRYYFDWPGGATVTTSSGSFEDVGDVLPMSASASGGSLWVERVVP